jgi:hypothetical protein
MDDDNAHLAFARSAAAEYLERIEQVTNTALASKVVPEGEKVELRLAIALAKYAASWFEDRVIKPTQDADPALAAHIYENLLTLLSSNWLGSAMGARSCGRAWREQSET